MRWHFEPLGYLLDVRNGGAYCYYADVGVYAHDSTDNGLEYSATVLHVEHVNLIY